VKDNVKMKYNEKILPVLNHLEKWKVKCGISENNKGSGNNGEKPVKTFYDVKISEML
jgi:hypothetical protein